MHELLENLIQKVLRVPPKPDPPLGARVELETFRAAPGYFHYRLLGWGLKQLGTAAGLVFGLFFLRQAIPLEGELRWLLVIEALAIATFLLSLPLSYMMVSLDYRYRWYMVTDRSLRIREGLGKVKEKTMTFSNIQNLTFRQGPIQRLFGIADLEVRTAGGGGGGQSGKNKDDPFADDLHVAYFRGVDNADAIRDLIRRHQRETGGVGLGDPDEPAPAATPPPTALPGPVATPDNQTLAAAHQLLTEVRQLRGVVG